MAAGEYVSVSSQADTESADLAREKAELVNDPASELAELTAIYKARGLDDGLAAQVAAQLTARDALGTHLRDEFGISDMIAAAPVQAALVSAATFAAGAAVPLAVAGMAPQSAIIWGVTAITLLALGGLGALGAAAGGAGRMKGAIRVLVWGALALAATAGVGRLFGVVAG